MNESDYLQEIYLVITTEKNKENAYRIGNILLTEKLVPCISIKNIESIFWWEGTINELNEVQLMIKCKKDNLNEVCKMISENHSYELPEIIYLPVSTTKDYYNWVYSI